MSWGDVFRYIIIDNPVSHAVISTGSAVLKSSGLKPREIKQIPIAPPPKPLSLWELSGGNCQFIRLAGLYGATAIMMGAYFKYSLNNISNPIIKEEAKSVFDTANRFHFMHSFALLASPLARHPLLTGILMAAGTILFSGPMYHRALTGDKTYTQVAAYGGFCLIAAWISFVF